MIRHAFSSESEYGMTLEEYMVGQLIAGHGTRQSLTKYDISRLFATASMIVAEAERRKCAERKEALKTMEKNERHTER